MGEHLGSVAPISPASFSMCASTTFLCRSAMVAELLLVLVVLADGVDEGAAVEAILAEPVFSAGKMRVSFACASPPPVSMRADEPFAPLLALALQHRLHQVGLRTEQFVQRGLGGAGLVDDGVDAGGVDSVSCRTAASPHSSRRPRADFIAGGSRAVLLRNSICPWRLSKSNRGEIIKPHLVLLKIIAWQAATASV